MKKGLLIALLVVAILTSVVTGTLAVYNTQLDELDGQVVAKAFILTDGDDPLSDINESPLKIAPTEKKVMTYNVMNFDGEIVSEVAMNVKTKFSIPAADDSTAIEPLVIYVKVEQQVGSGSKTNEGEYVYCARSGGAADYVAENSNVAANATILTGDEEITASVDLSAQQKATVTYTITVEWPDNGTALDYTDDNGNAISYDAQFQGSDFKNKVKIQASAKQLTQAEADAAGVSTTLE